MNTLPHGFHTHLGKVFQDGIELSGGEIQSLMLARTVYKNAPVIVLDEPTAALDPIAESSIYRKYDELTKGRTSLFISHCLASTRFCDRIILLSDQGIAEEGIHDELIVKNGQYAKLFQTQSQYYQKEGGGMCKSRKYGKLSLQEIVADESGKYYELWNAQAQDYCGIIKV